MTSFIQIAHIHAPVALAASTRLLDGSLAKELPRPNAEPGTHQHKQVSMVKVRSRDGPVCVCYRDGREENARGDQIGFH